MLERVSRPREISSVVLLTAPLDGWPAQLWARHCVGTIHAAELIASLRHFRRRLGRGLWLVWDHLNGPESHRVQTLLAEPPDAFALTWLPGYAPELNPEEQGTQWVTQAMLHALPGSIEELHPLVRGRFCRLQHRPALLAQFFTHAGLHVN